LSDGPKEVEYRTIPRHKKYPALGNKIVAFGSNLFVEGVDAKDVAEKEEVTLMDWGNVIIDKIHKDSSGKVVKLEGHLHLEGSVKDTKKKWTWLSDTVDNLKVHLVDFDYLITKKKLDEEDKFEDFINENSKTETVAIGDPNLRLLNKGSKMQLERRGYFICDRGFLTPDKPVILFGIPDGHTTKAQSVLTTPKDNK